MSLRRLCTSAMPKAVSVSCLGISSHALGGGDLTQNVAIYVDVTDDHRRLSICLNSSFHKMNRSLNSSCSQRWKSVDFLWSTDSCGLDCDLRKWNFGNGLKKKWKCPAPELSKRTYVNVNFDICSWIFVLVNVRAYS